MDEPVLPTVLCVDDEPQVLAALSLHLQSSYRVLTAASGADAIRLMRAHPEIDVVISDMRMPGLDGAKFLHAARSIASDVPRLLLTGHADLESAIAAVNDGQIFRFLVKPTQPSDLLAALAAAMRQRRLVTAERDLLQRTLRGAVQALTSALALRDPVAFGSGERVKRLSGEIAERLVPDLRWAVEIAAMLAPLGMIALPDDVKHKLHAGRPLDDDERAMIERLPALTDELIRHIPRLEVVRAMLALSAAAPIPRGCEPDAAIAPSLRHGVAILRAVLDFDELIADGMEANVALGAMRARGDRYAADVMDALADLRETSASGQRLREVSARELMPGMLIGRDVRLANSVLLVPRGFEVTEGLVERIRNLRDGALVGPIWIVDGSGRPPAS